MRVYIEKQLLHRYIIAYSCFIFRKYQKVTHGRSGGNKMAISTFLIFVERLSRPNRIIAFVKM